MNFVAKIPALSQEQAFRHELEKFKQQTEYVCLKLGIADWNAFLADVRIGNIVKKTHQTTPLPSNSLKPVQLPFPPSTKGPSSFDAIFNDLLENMSTKRSSSARKEVLQSPICSEGDVRYAMGGDTQRSDCSSASFPSNSATNDMEISPDTVENYRRNQQWSGNKQLLDQVMKNLEKFDNQKQLNTYDGFQTFRKASQHSNSENEMFEANPSEKSPQNQMTAKKCFYKIRQTEDEYEDSLGEEQWIKQSLDQEKTFGMKEFMLALQNTKLRRQLKNVTKMLEEKKKCGEFA